MGSRDRSNLTPLAKVSEGTAMKCDGCKKRLPKAHVYCPDCDGQFCNEDCYERKHE